MRQTAVVHANSVMLYNFLQKIHSNVYYVPNGVDEELFRPTKEIPKERKGLRVGHVGKACPAKHQKDVLEPAVRLAKVEYVNNYNTWKTKIPHDQMYKIYNDMDVYIAKSSEDGTPNPMLESMSCGRPVIINHIGNAPELVRNGYNGFIVGGSIEDYVEKMRYLAENRDKLIQMGENARKSILDGWTWKQQAENYRKMFADILM